MRYDLKRKMNPIIQSVILYLFQDFSRHQDEEPLSVDQIQEQADIPAKEVSFLLQCVFIMLHYFLD